MKFEDYVYYDETSPSGLRWKVDGKFGSAYKTPVYLKDQIAGSYNKSNGYWTIRICGKNLKVHRIICELMYPEKCIGKWVCDHLNGNNSDNRLENLRIVDVKLNTKNKKKSKNNTSGTTGVMFRTDNGGRYTYWAGYYQNEFGKRIEKKFSILTFGPDTAKRLAIEWREQKIKELIERGFGYTDRHGK